MSVYEIVKTLHIATVLISISGFILRGIWMIKASDKLNSRWTRVLPHINDTLLLLSAIVLVIITAQYPVSTTWINAKIVALIIYIALGTVALKRGKTKAIRITAGFSAILVFVYIVAVANRKSAFII